METDPIIVRLQCIDEATPVIIEFTDKLFKLQNMLMKFKMPELKFPEIQVPEIPEIKTPVIPTPEVPTIKPLIIPEIEIPKIPEIKIPELKAPIDFDINAGDLYKKVNVITAATKSVTLSAQQMTDVITRDFQRGLDQMNVEPIERLDQTLNEAGISSKQFANFLAQNNLEVIKGVGVYDRLSGAILTQGQAVKLATIQTRRFKFEWLSVMFAGMALDRVFGSLIQQQAALWGWSEGIASMWTIIMAPAMELISPIIWDIIEAIEKLPPDTQLTIGLTVFGLGGLGKIMTFFGQIYLGAMGINMVLQSLFGKNLATNILKAGGFFKWLGGIILGLGASFWIIAAIAVAVAIGIYLAWKENFLGMKRIVNDFWEGIKFIFWGIVDFFSGILKIIKGLFTGNIDKITEGAKQSLQGLGTFLYGLFISIGNGIAAIVIGTLRIIIGVVQSFINLLGAIPKLWGGKALWKVDWINKLKMPTFQEGGIMPYTGIAYLHAGERVIPKNQVNNAESSIIFSPSISINAEVSSDYDVRKLADELNYYWARDFERMVKGRVTI